MGGELKPMDYETDSDEEIDVHENGLENDTTSSRYSQARQRISVTRSFG